MSAIFNDPPFFGGLCNPDIQANKFTPLNLGQGSSPAPIPYADLSQPMQAAATSNTITVTFFADNIVGNLTFGILWGESSQSFDDYTAAIALSPSDYTVTMTGLRANRTYYCEALALNAAGETVSKSIISGELHLN